VSISKCNIKTFHIATMKDGQKSIVGQTDGGFPEFSAVAIMAHLPANLFSLAISPTERSGVALCFRIIAQNRISDSVHCRALSK
jgi:hypothetical protein